MSVKISSESLGFGLIGSIVIIIGINFILLLTMSKPLPVMLMHPLPPPLTRVFQHQTITVHVDSAPSNETQEAAGPAKSNDSPANLNSSVRAARLSDLELEGQKLRVQTEQLAQQISASLTTVQRSYIMSRLPELSRAYGEGRTLSRLLAALERDESMTERNSTSGSIQ